MYFQIMLCASFMHTIAPSFTHHGSHLFIVLDYLTANLLSQGLGLFGHIFVNTRVKNIEHIYQWMD